ncbi:hypothetical protein [Tsukamurella sp. 1534]|uniref:hypothetical protein n=1 Tax=Tsukamurella sp. 1534 TaxID=1151061 RepID=UPI0002D64669|nr:hypothetical protein [Tsukamurella sp. 1534]
MTADDLWPVAPAPYEGRSGAYLAAEAEARRIAADLAVAAPSGVLTRAAELDSARARFVDDYAHLVDATRERLTDVAARTGLARLQARGQAPPDDPGAEQAADLADQRGRAEAEDAAQEAQRRSAELAAGHGAALSGFAPMAAMGMMGRAMGGDGQHRAAHYDVPGAAPQDLNLRLRELCAAVGGPARSWVRMAVAAVTDEDGRPWRLIGTTELDGYLRPGVELREGELAAGNEAWPELSVATFCAAHGFAPGPVVGTVEPPGDVSEHLRALGFHPTWSPDAWAAGWEDADAPQY